MKYGAMTLLLLLAACSGNPDGTAMEDDSPVPQEPSSQEATHLVVRTGDPDSGARDLLTLDRTLTNSLYEPNPTYWEISEPVDVKPGDLITIIDQDEMCMESYPQICSARTFTVEESAGTLNTFGPYISGEGRPQPGFASFIGATVINASEPFTDVELREADSVTIIEVKEAADIVDHPDLPDHDVPLIVVADDEMSQEIADLLADDGYQVLIRLTYE